MFHDTSANQTDGRRTRGLREKNRKRATSVLAQSSNLKKQSVRNEPVKRALRSMGSKRTTGKRMKSNL